MQCIRASGVEHGIVLDPFMGSGTTALAAKLLGFDFIGFELNAENVTIALDRIDSAVGGLLKDATSSNATSDIQSKRSESSSVVSLFEG
jgi:DNA modification methylase